MIDFKELVARQPPRSCFNRLFDESIRVELAVDKHRSRKSTVGRQVRVASAKKNVG